MKTKKGRGRQVPHGQGNLQRQIPYGKSKLFLLKNSRLEFFTGHQAHFAREKRKLVLLTYACDLLS
jgi:hypothetical protein